MSKRFVTVGSGLALVAAGMAGVAVLAGGQPEAQAAGSGGVCTAHLSRALTLHATSPPTPTAATTPPTLGGSAVVGLVVTGIATAVASSVSLQVLGFAPTGSFFGHAP